MSEHRGPVNVNVNVSQSQGQQQSGGDGWVGCGGLLAVLLVFGGISAAFQASPVLGVVIVVLLVAAVVVVALALIGSKREAREQAERELAAVERAEAIRAETEGRAAVDAGGGCMWCGQRGAHRAADGHPVHPREWHALEVEEAVRAAGGSPPADDEPGARVWAQAPPPVRATPPALRHSATEPGPGPASDLLAQLDYSALGECLWCGAPSEHCTPTGRIIHPARVHQEEYERERAQRRDP